MRKLQSIIVVSVTVAVACILAGCAGTGGDSFKGRGVYTTLAVEGHHLDLPGSSYSSSKTFGPGQTPAAVVVGYGYWEGDMSRPQEYELQLVESATGALLLDTTGSAYLDRATVVKLPIRKTGNYQLKLLVNSTLSDTWDFTVNRGESPEATSTNTSQATYGTGFSASMESADEAEFNDYDTYLLQAVQNSAMRAAAKAADPSIFSQVPAGKTVVSFQLDDGGKVSSPRIVENTLGEALGQFFIEALQAGSPYKSWSGSSHSRQIKMTFYYE